ncbi:MAG: indole-3-glycerol phosphate synthase TrpC [Bacteroidales bacterium]
MNTRRNILDDIVDHKRRDLPIKRRHVPLSALRDMPGYHRGTLSLGRRMGSGAPGIIAEFKRKSPSLGFIHEMADPVDVAGGYRQAGVQAMSVLTDRTYFGGDLADLVRVRAAFPDLPLLRKDFVIDPYDLHEARAHGADLVLLIAAILEQGQVADLAQEAAQLGLQVLFEVHGAGELAKYHPSIPLVGVNNRNLKDFSVDIQTSLRMASGLPDGVIAVSESGLSSRSDLEELAAVGFQYFLMGERFMKEADPGKACAEFLRN